MRIGPFRIQTGIVDIPRDARIHIRFDREFGNFPRVFVPRQHQVHIRDPWGFWMFVRNCNRRCRFRWWAIGLA